MLSPYGSFPCLLSLQFQTKRLYEQRDTTIPSMGTHLISESNVLRERLVAKHVTPPQMLLAKNVHCQIFPDWSELI